mmetsp:Transcript_47934/g.70989  ORF Transcript_47934/g.70989 Transcript_47934/m.70989 type:complete len:354 (-) Transcript_47934:147-1208(-)
MVDKAVKDGIRGGDIAAEVRKTLEQPLEANHELGRVNNFLVVQSLQKSSGALLLRRREVHRQLHNLLHNLVVEVTSLQISYTLRSLGQVLANEVLLHQINDGLLQFSDLESASPPHALHASRPMLHAEERARFFDCLTSGFDERTTVQIAGRQALVRDGTGQKLGDNARRVWAVQRQLRQLLENTDEPIGNILAADEMVRVHHDQQLRYQLLFPVFAIQRHRHEPLHELVVEPRIIVLGNLVHEVAEVAMFEEVSNHRFDELLEQYEVLIELLCAGCELVIRFLNGLLKLSLLGKLGIRFQIIVVIEGVAPSELSPSLAVLFLGSCTSPIFLLARDSSIFSFNPLPSLLEALL